MFDIINDIDISYCLNEDSDEMIVMHVTQCGYQDIRSKHNVKVSIAWNQDKEQQPMVAVIASHLKDIFKVRNAKYKQLE